MKNRLFLSLVLCILFNLNGIAQSAVFESLKFDSKKLGKEDVLLDLPAVRLQHLAT